MKKQKQDKGGDAVQPVRYPAGFASRRHLISLVVIDLMETRIRLTELNLFRHLMDEQTYNRRKIMISRKITEREEILRIMFKTRHIKPAIVEKLQVENKELKTRIENAIQILSMGHTNREREAFAMLKNI